MDAYRHYILQRFANPQSQPAVQTLPLSHFQAHNNSFSQKFVLSASALNNFMACPLKFYYQNVVGIDFGKTKSTAYGAAMHAALERLFRNMLSHPQRLFDDAPLLNTHFEKAFNGYRDLFADEYDQFLQKGKTVLAGIHERHAPGWNKVVAIERRFNRVQSGDFYIRGIIDKIEFDGYKAKVVDYKTGNTGRLKDALCAPGEDSHHGGDYWRQAMFYAMLVNAAPNKWQCHSVAFHCLEPDENGHFALHTIDISEAALTTVREQSRYVFTQIKAQQYFEGCGAADCKWCSLAASDEVLKKHSPKVKDSIKLSLWD